MKKFALILFVVLGLCFPMQLFSEPVVDTLYTDNDPQKQKVTSVLLDGITAMDDGDWLDVSKYDDISIHISGIGTATVKLCGSLVPTRPDNTDHEIELDSLTSDNIDELEANLRWIKARCSSYSSGTIYVWLLAEKEFN